MKPRLCSFLVLFVATVILLTSCNANITQSDSNESSSKGDAVQAESSESDSSRESETSAQNKESVEGYNYENVNDCYTLLTSGQKLISSTVELEMNMWETIYKYPDDKDITSTFSSMLNKSKGAPQMIQCNTLLELKYESEKDSNGDPNVLPLLKNCVDSYGTLHNLVIDASGTYSEFKSAYSAATDDFIFNYDEMVAYLYEVGYFHD